MAVQQQQRVEVSDLPLTQLEAFVAGADDVYVERTPAETYLVTE